MIANKLYQFYHIYIYMRSITKKTLLDKIQPRNSREPIQTESLQSDSTDFLKKISQSIDTLLQLNISHYKDPRQQSIYTQKPVLPSNTQQRAQQIQRWVTKLVELVLSQAFRKLTENQLSENQTKIYCSENLLKNVMMLSKENKLSCQDFETINLALLDSLKYSSYKYPLTDNTTQINKKLDRSISKVNTLDSNINNIILNSGLSFDYSHTGSYNEQIMKFMNYLMQVIGERDHNGRSRFERFQQFCENIFNKVQNPVWVNSLQEYSPSAQIDKLQKIHQQIITKVQAHESASTKDQQLKKYSEDYKEKVRAYTSYQINRKISENTNQYSALEIQSDNLDVRNPAIARILGKWCQELERKFFDQEYFLRREEDLVQRNGHQTFFLKGSKAHIAKLIAEEKEQIQQFIRDLNQNMYQNQSHAAYQSLKKDNINYIQEQQKVLGKFATISNKCLQTYLIVYLNRLLHGLIKISQQYYDNNLKNIYVNWQSPPQFVSFLVGDLLRCKFSSGQKEVLRVYRQIQMLSELQPSKIKIVRVKNRLQQGTNDILINIRFEDLVLCEIQLAVKNSKNQFMHKANTFSHYIYELTRSKFGPISEMANIWFSKDPRAKEFQKIMENIHNNMKNNPFKSSNFHRCSEANMKVKVEKLPFICSICKIHKFRNQYLSGVLDNIRCLTCKDFEICGECRLHQLDEQALRKLFFKTRPQDFLTQIKLLKGKQFPDYGIFIPIYGKKIQIEYFKSLEYENKIYLIGVVNRKFKLFGKFAKKGLDKSSFFKENVLFETSEINELKSITIRSLIKDFIVKQYLQSAYTNGKQTISLQGFSLSEDDILQIQNEAGPKKIKNFILKNNNIRSIAKIAQRFPNLQLFNLNTNLLESLEGVSAMRALRGLKVAANLLESIPEELGMCRNLETISIQKNKLKAIPKIIGQLKHLKQLWCYSNELQQIPTEIGNLQNLTHLILHQNNLKSLPASLPALSKLDFLKIQSNKLESLPPDFHKLHKLTNLLAFKNKLAHLPERFGELKLLVLNLRGNCFEEFPEEICQIECLRRLNLSENKITTVPESMGKLINLFQFRISDNSISVFPQSLKNMLNLQTLDLSSNRLTALPQNLSKLTRITYLNICKNKLSSLPTNFHKLTNLANLNLSFNELPQFPVQLLSLQKLNTLQIQDNKIRVLPHDIWQLTNLSFLHVENNFIEEIPDSIVSLDNLRNVGVGNPGMKSISPVIYGLKTVRFLEISCIGLESIPQQVYKMVELTQLDMHGNKITEIPPQIASLRNLNHLNCETNLIKKISSELSTLPHLTHLKLKRNQISALPPQFYSFKKLKFLNLSFNKLQFIPQQFAKLRTLSPKSLFLFENPIERVSCYEFLMEKCSVKSGKLIKQVHQKFVKNKEKQSVGEVREEEMQLIEQQL